MGVILIGTLYNPRQSNIPWSQPGGPGTIVFPQEAINIPFAAYPVAGIPWAENSGLWQVSCGHSVNEAMILQDGNGFVGALTYLQDNLGRNWRISVYDNGQGILAIPVSYSVNLSTVLLQDTVLSQNWQMTLLANGTGVDIVITPVAGTGQSQLLVGSPNSSLYAIQVSNGVLETAVPLGQYGTPVAVVVCPMCSYVEYVIPIAQFYSTWQTPVTFI
jgi:hypothetical protein